MVPVDENSGWSTDVALTRDQVAEVRAAAPKRLTGLIGAGIGLGAGLAIGAAIIRDVATAMIPEPAKWWAACWA
jgi:hypothetical protein